MATKNLRDDFQVGVDLRLEDLKNALGSDEKQEAIGEALAEYSKDKPQTAADDITGDAGFDYLLSDLASYEDGFSWITNIEYPYDSSAAIPNNIEDDRWAIYNSGSAKYLRFLDVKPATSETFRAHYTIPYVFDDSDNVVIPLADFRALCNLATAYALRAVAAKFVHTGDPSFSADVVNYRSKSREAMDLAKVFAKAYRDHMGLKDDAPARGASVTVDQDMEYSFGGDFLTHPARWR